MSDTTSQAPSSDGNSDTKTFAELITTPIPPEDLSVFTEGRPKDFFMYAFGNDKSREYLSGGSKDPIDFLHDLMSGTTEEDRTNFWKDWWKGEELDEGSRNIPVTLAIGHLEPDFKTFSERKATKEMPEIVELLENFRTAHTEAYLYQTVEDAERRFSKFRDDVKAFYTHVKLGTKRPPFVTSHRHQTTRLMPPANMYGMGRTRNPCY